MPDRLKLIQRTQTSVTMYISSLSETATYTSAYISISGNGVNENSVNLAPPEGSVRSYEHTFYDLQCGNTYTASYNLTSLAGSTASGTRYDISTLDCPAPVRPLDWDWSISKTKGVNYTIINNQFTNLVTASELANFRVRILEFREYKNAGAYTFVNMPQGGTFTAAMYNSLNGAISAMIPPISTYGSQTSNTSYTVDELLNRLKDSLNSIT